MQVFQLIREVDSTGISGTGVVADGVIFQSGKVTMCWRGEVSSIVIYDRLSDVETIHCHRGTSILFQKLEESD